MNHSSCNQPTIRNRHLFQFFLEIGQSQKQKCRFHIDFYGKQTAEDEDDDDNNDEDEDKDGTVEAAKTKQNFGALLKFDFVHDTFEFIEPSAHLQLFILFDCLLRFEQRDWN